MGFFKEMKDLKKNADAIAPKQKRPGFTDMMKQANAAMQDVQTMQTQATELMTTGEDGTATVSFIQATGTMINNFPEIEFKLQVSKGGGSAYEVTHRQVVSPVSIPALQPGATVAVKVDPADQNRVYLVVA